MRMNELKADEETNPIWAARPAATPAAKFLGCSSRLGGEVSAKERQMNGGTYSLADMTPSNYVGSRLISVIITLQGKPMKTLARLNTKYIFLWTPS